MGALSRADCVAEIGILVLNLVAQHQCSLFSRLRLERCSMVCEEFATELSTAPTGVVTRFTSNKSLIWINLSKIAMSEK